MSYCYKCGYELKPGERTCPKCGKRVKNKEAKVEPYFKNDSKGTYALSFFLPLAGFIMFFQLRKNRPYRAKKILNYALKGSLVLISILYLILIALYL